MSQNMATKLKKKLSTKNLTALLVFGAIILVFALFGLPSKMGGGMGAAARVNETFISLREWDSAVKRLEQMYAQYLGGMSLDPKRQKELKFQALQSLIEAELISQSARQAGLRATPAEIRDMITKDIPIFQKDGQFQREIFNMYLQNTGMSAREFENLVRKDIESNRMRRLFESSSRTLTLESEKQQSLQNFKMNLQFVKFEDGAANPELVTPSEAQKALEAPEFAKKIEDEFNNKKASLSQKEEIKAQHILISTKQGDPASEKAALEKIKDIQKKATTEDFGKLAQQFSEDPGSKAKKGDLGFFGRGQMVKEFEEVAFNLKPGTVSEPVKSPFGYHLIKVNEKKAAKEAKLEDHRIELTRQTLAKDKWQSKAQELEKKISESPNEIENEVKAMGYKWDETGSFDLNSSSVPKISELDIEKVVALTPSSPWMKTLLRAGNARYLIKLKTLETRAEGINPVTSDMAQKRRAMGLFSGWVAEFRKDSTVETNNHLFQ